MLVPKCAVLTNSSLVSGKRIPPLGLVPEVSGHQK